MANSKSNERYGEHEYVYMLDAACVYMIEMGCIIIMLCIF